MSSAVGVYRDGDVDVCCRCTEMVMLYVISVGVYRDGDVVCHLLLACTEMVMLYVICCWRVQRW